MSKNEEMVKVKVLTPIAHPVGPCLVYGMKAEFPKKAAEAFIKNGEAELWVGVDLAEAIEAVEEAGGEISFEKDNVALISAYEKLSKKRGGDEKDVRGKDEVPVVDSKEKVDEADDGDAQEVKSEPKRNSNGKFAKKSK